MLDYLFGRGQISAILLVALALAASLFALGRTLPAQNVFAAAGLIALISGLIETLGTKTGIPFGPFFYTENLGPAPFHLLPWPVPAIWIIAILNSRGTARLILRPWRELPNYGIYSLALTCLLVVIFDANLEPWAARTNHFWIWQTPKSVPAWYGAPWINFPAWATVTLLILGFATPWLINKKPVTDPPPDYPPLILWLTVNFLLTAANAAHHLWLATIFGLTTTTFIAFIAIRNSRAQKIPISTAAK